MDQQHENVGLMSDEEECKDGIITHDDTLPSFKRLESDYKIDLSADDYHACCISWRFIDLWGKSVDLDMTVIALDQHTLEMDVVHSKKKSILNNSVQSTRNIFELNHENRQLDPEETNSEQHDQIKIDLKQLPKKCYSLWFVVNGNIEDIESAEFKLRNKKGNELYTYSVLLSGYNPTAMLLGVLWRDDNGIDWNYNQISEHGKGVNYEESKSILYKSLYLVYPQNIINNRPNDRHQNYTLNKSESYVIDPNIERSIFFSKRFWSSFCSCF